MSHKKDVGTITVRKCLPEGAHPIWKIGDLDNQHPNKWSSTVLSSQGLPVIDHSADCHYVRDLRSDILCL